MALTYDWSVNLGDANNTITMQYHAVPPGSLVLDVGCATGFLGAALADHKGCTYVGLELDEDQAAAGRERGLDVLTGDITDPGDQARVVEHAGRRFDAIVLGDVLEHLNDPFTTLQTLVDTCLDRAGIIITSIPNVTHGSLRLDLLRGRFTYTRTGLLDVTHVQLFTRERVGELYDRAGLQMTSDQRSYFPVFGTEGRVQQGELPADIEQFVMRDPESFTYQFITTGRPALTRDAIAAATAGRRPRTQDASAVETVTVVPVGVPSAEWMTALTLAIPDRYRLEVASPVDGPATLATAVTDIDGAVLAIDVGTVPTATWVGPLIEAHRRHGGVVGSVRAHGDVIDAAGWTADGRAIGRGAGIDIELVQSDRATALLGLPWMAEATEATPDADGRLPGRLVAASVAPTQPGPAEGAAFSEGAGPVTVVVGRAGPHRLDEETRRALVDASGDGTVVYRWTSEDLLDSREHARHLQAEGLVLVGGTPQERVGALPRTTAGLARHLDAGRVIWLDDELARAEVVATGVHQPAATRVAPGEVRYCDQSGALDALRAPAVAPQHPVPIPHEVAPVETVAGRVSVVIPMYGLGSLTAATVDAVRATTEHLDVEVVVVDNGSPIEDRRAVAEADVDTWVDHEENLGFARGVNAGLDVATGEYVCVLNNDTVPLEGWLDELLAALSRPGVSMVGSRSDEISGLQRLDGVPLLADDPLGAREAGLAHARRAAGRVFPLARLVGFCLLAERVTLERLGGFAVPDALGNFEDDELSSRLLRDGGELLVADGSVVLHHGSQTFRRTAVDYRDQMLRAGRSMDAPFPPGGPLGVVISDGAVAPVIRSVRSLLAVVDEVVVVADRRGPDIALALAEVPQVRVQQSPAGLERRTRPHLVLMAGEEVAVADARVARAALHEAAVPASVTTSEGPQTRWVPAGRFDLLGVGSNALEGLSIR